jgi:TolB-like protein
MDFIVISMLAAAVILFAYDKWWIGPPPEKSIAVLAFENMSADPEQEYFSDGISEELLNVLAQIPELTVISRSSAFSFKGQDIAIPKVAEQLNVAHVLEGSVRKMGNRVRITAQLIEARSDSHLWSETYDRKLDDIFAIQDEISAAIVGAIKEELGLQVDAAPRAISAANTEAHEAYLRGRYLVAQRTRATLEAAVHEFEKAVELDSEYAIAHAELAIATVFLNRGFLGDLSLSEAIARAAPHAEQAMALDPTLAEGHAAAGMLLYLQWNPEEALAHYEQAIRSNPNYAIVYNWMGNILASLGRYEEQLTAYETGLQLDPLSIASRSNYVAMLINRNQLDAAARELAKLVSISPAMYAARSGFLTSVRGKWANAALGNLDFLRIDPESVFVRRVLALNLAAIGLETEALVISDHLLPIVLSRLGKSGVAVRTAEARLAEDPINFLARHDLGLALASAGDYTRARPILEEMWQRAGGRVTCCHLFSGYSAAALITIRRDADEAAEVGELLAAIRDNVRRYREAGIMRVGLSVGVDFEEGLAAYLSGEHEKGLALIAESAQDGFFILQSEAYLQALYDDPGFAPIQAGQESRQARERKRFLDIVCNENPYADVWQPAEGTCERFAAAGGN